MAKPYYLGQHYNGRIWITWKPGFYHIVPIRMNALTCEVCYVPLEVSFLVTFVYAFNTKEERKSLWEYLLPMNGQEG